MKISRLSLTDTLGLETGLILNGAFSFLSVKMMYMKGPQLTQLLSKQTAIMNILKIEQSTVDGIASGIKANAAFVFFFG